MRRLTGNAVDGQLLQTLWLQRLPARVQESLSVVEGAPLEKMAELTDKAIERILPASASVNAAFSVETNATSSSAIG